MQGLESVAVIQGKKLIDYGKEVRYGYRTADWSEDIGEDIEGLTPAELSFVSNSQTKIVNRNSPGTVEMGTKVGGFHFLRRIGTVNVNTETGEMTVPQSTTDDVRTLSGDRYYPSQKRTYKVHMLSLLNDFRRIAETYKDGNETGFREGSWLWAFIGNPYKFYVINKEAGPKKRLAVVGGDAQGAGAVLKLTKDFVDTAESSNCYFTISKQAVQTDEEEYRTFVMQVWDGDDSGDNDMMVQWRYDNNGQFFTEKKNVGNKNNNPKLYPDIAKMKTASFMAFAWNWDDKKYQKVTVNIYPGTEANHGALALTKTYERSDRAFVAGDVIDGTDGHFYLPLDAQEDGSWKPFGVYTNTIPYDGHKINIPHELRRRYCKYTVENGSYTVQQDDSDNPTAQVINVYYTVDTENAPLFISESDLATFRSLDADATFKGKKKRDYFYFLDQNWQLAKHLYVRADNKGYSEPTRFSATNDPKQLMWYFVGDPYNVRLFNVYTDINSTEPRNFVRHRYADKNKSHGYGEDRSLDDKTYMEKESDKVFYWEMVDTWVGDPKTKGELDSTHVNVSFRKELLYGKPFALRMKVTGSANPAAVISDATYFYLKDDGNTFGSNIYNSGEGSSLSPKMNQLNAFANFPDSRHLANSTSTTLTPLTPTKVYVTVFDPDEPTRKVTEEEVSDYYAVTDHFKGVPDNLQRKHCEYWWVSTDDDPKSTNMVDENLYFTVSEENPHIYARYREDAESPFSTLVDGKPVLKRDASLSPWYNMNIGGWWAFFNSSLDGKTYLIPGTTPNVFNNSTVSFVYKGNTLPDTSDKFHKGLQWALIGDPYNFTLRNNRDRMVTSSLDSERTTAYLNENTIAEDGTVWTWLHNGVKTSEYFLTESTGRRTEVTSSSSNSARATGGPLRILPSIRLHRIMYRIDGDQKLQSCGWFGFCKGYRCFKYRDWRQLCHRQQYVADVCQRYKSRQRVVRCHRECL